MADYTPTGLAGRRLLDVLILLQLVLKKAVSNPRMKTLVTDSSGLIGSEV